MNALFASIGHNLFLVFGLLACAGAAVMILSTSAVHSVLGFLFSMIMVAACFLCLSAEFLGMAQLLVYAGGIVVLFLFVVMLVELTKYKEKSLFTTQIKWSLPLVLVALGIFAYTMQSNLFGAAAPVALSLPPDLTQGLSASAQNAQMVSRGLFAGFLLPLEILSVILLVALVGALVLAKSERVS